MSPLDPLLIMIGMGGVAFMLYAFTAMNLVKGPARLIATSTLMLVLVLVGHQLLAPSRTEEAEQPWFEDPFANILSPNFLSPSLETAETGWRDIPIEALDLLLTQGLVDNAPPSASPSPLPTPSLVPPVQPSVQAPIQPSVQAPSPVQPAPVQPAPVQPAPVQPIPLPSSPVQPAPGSPNQIQPSPIPPSPIPSLPPGVNPGNQPVPYPDSAPHGVPDQSEPVPAWW